MVPSTFEVFSADCPLCRQTLKHLKGAIGKRGCGCTVEETACDGHCDAARKHGFAGKERPVIVRDGTVVHEGSLSTEQAASLLPA